MLAGADRWYRRMGNDGQKGGEFADLKDHDKGDQQDKQWHGLKRIIYRAQRFPDTVEFRCQNAQTGAQCERQNDAHATQIQA